MSKLYWWYLSLTSISKCINLIILIILIVSIEHFNSCKVNFCLHLFIPYNIKYIIKSIIYLNII